MTAVNDPVVFRDMFGKDHAATITALREGDGERVDLTFPLGAKSAVFRNVLRAGDEPAPMTWRLP